MRGSLKKNSNKYMSRIVSMVLIVTILFGMPAESFTQKTQNTIEVGNAEETQKQVLKEEPEILAELKENRDEYTKCFALDNGDKMLVQYKDPVHFEDAKGNWVNYDNRMTLTNDILSTEDDVNPNLNTAEAVTENLTEQQTEKITSADQTVEETTERISLQTAGNDTEFPSEENQQAEQPTQSTEEIQEEYKTINLFM